MGILIYQVAMSCPRMKCSKGVESRPGPMVLGGLICVLQRAFSAPVEDAHRLDAFHSERYTHSSHVDRHFVACKTREVMAEFDPCQCVI
jgi:hypothetical protein